MKERTAGTRNQYSTQPLLTPPRPPPSVRPAAAALPVAVTFLPVTWAGGQALRCIDVLALRGRKVVSCSEERAA